VDIRLDKGAEMGRFNLGSTVIVLTGENVELDERISEGNTVRVGQGLGEYS
jgi:phosphatidylserine decarboxylase